MAAMSTTRRLRLLIADDHRPTREELVAQLELTFEIVGAYSDGVNAARVAAVANPDICLLDVQMPEASGIEAAFDIRHRVPDAIVVLMSASPNDEDLAGAIKAGAHGYFDESLSNQHLPDILRAVASAKSVPAETASTRPLRRRKGSSMKTSVARRWRVGGYRRSWT